MSVAVDVLVPTCERPDALAVTLASLAAQTFREFRVIVSDQGEDAEAAAAGPVRAVARVLAHRGTPVEFHRHLPRRGIAEQRQFLLDQAEAPAVLFLDDDVICEPDLLERMVAVLREQGCGFVGSGLIGLSYRDDHRPQHEWVELWEERVQPEVVLPGTPAWQRASVHSAANLLHVQERLQPAPGRWLLYKVAWIGGCVLYDAAALRACGGFGFWRDLPSEHAGEDVAAQQRVMARYGGCGLLPSGAYHQEVATTIPNRDVDAPHVLPPPRLTGGVRSV